MSSIQIIPKEETYTTTSVYIQNIFVDIQNDTVTIEVNKLDETGRVIDRQTLIASGNAYHEICDEDVLNDFVLNQLGLVKQ